MSNVAAAPHTAHASTSSGQQGTHLQNSYMDHEQDGGIVVDPAVKSVLAHTWQVLEQPPPPTLREILAAYKARGDGDREMLLAMLAAKSAEDQRLASTVSLQKSLLDLHQQSLNASLEPHTHLPQLNALPDQPFPYQGLNQNHAYSPPPQQRRSPSSSSPKITLPAIQDHIHTISQDMSYHHLPQVNQIVSQPQSRQQTQRATASGSSSGSGSTSAPRKRTRRSPSPGLGPAPAARVRPAPPSRTSSSTSRPHSSRSSHSAHSHSHSHASSQATLPPASRSPHGSHDLPPSPYSSPNMSVGVRSPSISTEHSAHSASQHSHSSSAGRDRDAMAIGSLLSRQGSKVRDVEMDGMDGVVRKERRKERHDKERERQRRRTPEVAV